MCGTDRGSPCHGLAAFLNRTGRVGMVGQILVLNGSSSGSTIPSAQVHLSPGTYQTDPIFLYGISNWSFIGMGDVAITVKSFQDDYNQLWPYMSYDQFRNATLRYVAALYFRECSGIEIVNIDFSVAVSVTALSALTIDQSGDFDVIDCGVTEVHTNSSALVIINPVGPIYVRSFLVQDLYSTYPFQRLFLITFSKLLDGMGRSVTVTLSNITLMDIMQPNYTGCPPSLNQILSGAIAYPPHGYQFNTKSAGVILVQFKQRVHGNTFIFEDSTIEGVQPAGHDSPLAVQFSSATYNDVIIRNCTFSHNTGYFGGAVDVVFTGAAKQNSITFSECTFEANSALYNGGAVSVEFFHDQEVSSVMFERCQFQRNSASFGGAVMARFTTMTDFHISKHNYDRVVQFVDCDIFNNTADHGIIDGHSVLFKVDGRK